MDDVFEEHSRLSTPPVKEFTRSSTVLTLNFLRYFCDTGFVEGRYGGSCGTDLDFRGSNLDVRGSEESMTRLLRIYRSDWKTRGLGFTSTPHFVRVKDVPVPPRVCLILE